jgi:5-methylcytosine-specific restriction endonuclease McrA
MAKQKKTWVWFDADLWLNDFSLRKCSFAARGLWLECLCWMWEADEGFLEGDIVGLERLTRCLNGEFQSYISELEANSVTVVKRDGDWIHISGGKWFDMRPGKRSRYIPKAVRNRILAAGECRYCGATEALEVDHIHPFSAGGTHDPSNLQCCCLPCNRKKKHKPHREFLQSLRNAHG